LLVRHGRGLSTQSSLSQSFPNASPRQRHLAVTSAPILLATFGAMAEVIFKTWRAHRNLIERLRAFDKVYETEISDGERTARGRGQTKRDSQVAAQRNWIAQFGGNAPEQLHNAEASIDQK
jgi:hypothetical protein